MRALMWPMGLLLIVGTLGCGDEPAPDVNPGPVAGGPKQSPTNPEFGRDAAIAAIEKLGGEVGYDEESPDRPIATVRLAGTKVTEAHLVHMKGLTSLKHLELRDTQVADAGLVHLKGLTDLQLLLLSNTQITDAGLEHLRGLTNLTFLGLVGTKVTDEGLENLNGLTALIQLDLSHTQVTEEGIEKLQEALPNCEISR